MEEYVDMYKEMLSPLKAQGDKKGSLKEELELELAQLKAETTTNILERIDVVCTINNEYFYMLIKFLITFHLCSIRVVYL